MAVAHVANRLQRSTALGGGGIGPLMAQSGFKSHSLYLARLRRGVRIATVFHSGKVNPNAQVQATPQASFAVMEAASTEELANIPLWMQGDASLATEEKLAERNALRYDRRVGAVLNSFWETALRSTRPVAEGGGDADAEGLDRSGHAIMLKRLYRVMIKDIDEDDCAKSIEKDWISDARGKHLLGRRQFGDAFFELADTWTAGISPYEYAAFLKRVFALVAKQEPVYVDGTLFSYVSVWKDEADCMFDEDTFAEDEPEADKEEHHLKKKKVKDKKAAKKPCSKARRMSQRQVSFSQERRSCANKIQSAFRGKRERSKSTARRAAVIKLQAVSRGSLDRKKVIERKQARLLAPPPLPASGIARSVVRVARDESLYVPDRKPPMRLVQRPPDMHTPLKLASRQGFQRALPKTGSPSMPLLPTLVWRPGRPTATHQRQNAPDPRKYRSPYLAEVAEREVRLLRRSDSAVWGMAGPTIGGGNRLAGRALIAGKRSRIVVG